jgi:hypothetical protein
MGRPLGDVFTVEGTKVEFFKEVTGLRPSCTLHEPRIRGSVGMTSRIRGERLILGWYTGIALGTNAPRPEGMEMSGG